MSGIMRRVSEEQQPSATFLEELYGEDESDVEEQRPASIYDSDSDQSEYDEPFAPPYSAHTSLERRANELPDDPPLYQDHRTRERSRSPLGRYSNPPQESSVGSKIVEVLDFDGTPLAEAEVEFFEPDVHETFETTDMSAPDLDVSGPQMSERGRAPGRSRGRGRGRPARGHGVGRRRRVADQRLSCEAGHPLEEIWLSDDDVPSELREMARDLIMRRRMNERMNDDVLEDVTDGTDIPLQGEDLHFEWSPMKTFRGEEEVFRPTRIGAVESYATAYDAFRSFWDDSIMQLIADRTNRYASKISSRDFESNWHPTNVHEVLCLFGFWMMLGIIKMPTIHSCFAVNPLLKTSVFRRIFTRARYENLTRALHFVDEDPVVQAADPSTSDPNASFDRLYCLRPILEHLNAKFQANYIPRKDICIDESLTLWKGRLNFKQYIRSKAAKFGIKTFELCESATGYLWSFIVYTGKQSTTDLDQASGTLKSFAVVKKLISPLLNKGYRLFMDNWYNSPLLARYLKRNGTDCVGTLCPSRKDVPLVVTKAPLMRGQLVARHSGDVCVLAWQDKKRVTMLSTCHGSDIALPTVHTNPGRPNSFKPQVVIDYNRSTGRVDLKDHMLEPYLIERKRGNMWSTKLFKRLLNVSVINSRILVESSKNSRLDHLNFRLQLVDEILFRHLPHIPEPRLNSAERVPHLVPLPVHHDHWPIRIQSRDGRSNNRQARARCVVCQANRKEQKTPFKCEACNIPLCAEVCFKAYHTRSYHIP